MDEQFEHRSLLPLETLRTLQQPADLPSVLRLSIHLAVLLWSAVAIVTHCEHVLFEVVTTLVLALTWASIFAPFHEATHQTAFASRRANDLVAWLTSIPFGLTPAVYRTFHFEHHRHTQDPERDPEIAGDPRSALWPTTPQTWWRAILGTGLMWLKLRLTFGFVLLRT